MDVPPAIPSEILDVLDVSAPEFVVGTQIANIWKVTRRSGAFAALKVYHNQDMKNEGPGFDFLSALAGRGAARVFERAAGVVLLEWLEGPSLGDLTRDGQDIEASKQLVAVANLIHSNRLNIDVGLPNLIDWFEGLFKVQLAPALPFTARRDMNHCKDVARRLLMTQTDVRPLHGDLHHDNIRRSFRGYCAFDAKGVLGERTFELANAIRNPKGATETVHNSARLRFLVETWSADFDVSRRRLLEWAMVKTALSISWRCGAMLEVDSELAFLSMIREVIDQT